MSWLVANWTHLGPVAGKAALMFAVAAVGLRLGERRTLAQWSIIDFVTAVAIGAIVGRTAVAGTQSFVTGAAALVTLLVMHRLLSWARMLRPLRTALDHRVRILMCDGVVRPGELTRCGLTRGDLEAHLRQSGVFDIGELRYVLYESQGGLTLVRHEDAQAPLVRTALDSDSQPNRRR